MRHPARWIALGVGALVAVLAIALATQVGEDPRADATTSRLPGKVVPDFRVRTLEGDVLSDESLAGSAVIVNFWNTWCIPCREELPVLREFFAEHRGEADFEMLGIVRDDTESAVRADVDGSGIDWTVAFDPGARAALAFGTRGQPETYAISPDGVVVAAHIGPASLDTLEQMLDAARGRR